MKTKNITIYFILFYIWILVVGPQQRFPILETIRLERVSMLLCWAALFLSGRLTFRFTLLSVLILIFYMWLELSYLISPYKSISLAQDWAENYWKLIVLYFLILFAIKDLKDFYVLSAGIVMIVLVYQIHSWLDFVRGGSYVYQQGVKRIVGIWTSGLGAPNYFGMLAMLSLPFAYFWFQLTDSRITRLILLGHFAISFLTIVFSGTRGALLGAIVFVMLNMRNIKRIITVSVLVAVLLGVTFVILPDHLRYRYFGVVMSEQAAARQDENAEEISEMSAKSRIEGLVDGYKLAKLKPFTGFGPASSARARNLVNPSLKFIYEDYLQLHNLYGQILAESGFVGMAIFMSIVFVFFIQLRKLKEESEAYPFLEQFKFLVQNFMMLMLFYGMISHTLYRYYWFIVFAMHGALISIVKFDKEKLEDFALEREEEPLEIPEGEN